MKKIAACLATVCAGILTALAPTVTLAIPTPCGVIGGDCSTVDPNRGTGGIWSIVGNITTIIITAAGVLAVIMIIISAVRMTTSGGNPETVKSAKSTLMWSVIGLVLALLSIVIINLVNYVATKIS